MSEHYLPPETARLVKAHLAGCKNLALVLDKYPPRNVVEDTKHKGPWLQSLLQGNHLDPALARAAYARWSALLQARGALTFQAALAWRMVVGLGKESVLETALTLHHLYGLPCIPGSALKGLTRAYVSGEIAAYKSDNEACDHADIKRIFGTQEQAGTVVFFDALPTDGKAAFALDLMNPHYSEYYRGDRPPGNDQKPIPVSFLTVADTTFTFALAGRPGSDQSGNDDVGQVGVWLPQALQHYGVGGKTSAGYGYMQAASPISVLSAHSGSGGAAANDGELQAAERARDQLASLKASEFAGQVQGYYQHWQHLTSEEARALLARAIVENVRRAGREKVSAEKGWYKALLAFLETVEK
ncbi:MAG TPA: type III-B CRISPR module RAMP protein Cmr6 [Ktedonobacteraceae bacterium]|jgi:CRISPR-associated protein Cmr6